MEAAATVVQVAVNSGWDYAWMILIVLAGFVTAKVVRFLCTQAVQRAALREDGFRRSLLDLANKSITLPAVTLAVCFASKFLLVAENLAGMLADIRAILITIMVTYLLYQGVEILSHWLKRFAARTQTTLDDMIIPLVQKTLRVVLVLLGLVQIAQQLSDKPITSILAGLGVGGLAVALAAQDTIKNFFGSLVIFADHPFQLGDRIVVNGEDGTVEEVGMRSTRIRTLDGHVVTVPNGELANMMIRNISSRPYIKRVANIGVTYDTPPEKVELAIEIIKETLDAHNEKMHPDMPSRVFFNNFNDCSLNILVLYWFAPPDYWAFLEFDQAFNMTVLKRFNEEGIEFAFPTQTLYLAGDDKRPLRV